MSISRLILWAFLCAAMMSPRCLADGGVFLPGTAKVEIPDQDALIVWRDGQETLAIETRFVAPGHNFAWVVPLPSVPEISPATTGLFPTLRALTAPEVINKADGTWFLFLWASLMLTLAIFARSWSRIAAILVALLIPGSCLCLLPSLGSSRGFRSIPTAVEVLDRRIIGSYEVSTVASKDDAALAAWLSDHGFAIPPSVKPAIADYVKDGWVFVAVKLQREEDSPARSAPHPLVFKFKTASAVYPLRLTATESEALKVDLYVFGPGRASAKWFSVERCAASDIDPVKDPYDSRSVQQQYISITHSALAALVEKGCTLTKLSATLSPAQMAGDATIRFGDVQTYRPRRYTDRSAVSFALRLGSGVYLACVLGIGLVLSWRPYQKHAKRLLLAALVLGAISGTGAYGMLPQVREEHTFLQSRMSLIQLQYFAGCVIGQCPDPKRGGDFATEERVRGIIRKTLNDLFHDEPKRIEEIKEGDSPGCYTFRITPEGDVQFFWYDYFGQEHTFE